MQTETSNVSHRCETTLVIKQGRWVDFCDESGECGYHVSSGWEISCDLAERNSSSLIIDFKVPSSTSIRINDNRTASWTEYPTQSSNTVRWGYILFCKDVRPSTYLPQLKKKKKLRDTLHHKIKHTWSYLAENSSGIKALVLQILS